MLLCTGWFVHHRGWWQHHTCSVKADQGFYATPLQAKVAGTALIRLVQSLAGMKICSRVLLCHIGKLSVEAASLKSAFYQKPTLAPFMGKGDCKLR